MEGKFNNKPNTRPALDRLKGEESNTLSNDLKDILDQIPLEKFQGEDLEYVFQLMEAKLRATDAIHLKEALEGLRNTLHEKWGLICKHAKSIEAGTIGSAASHQLIALIQLVDEG